MKIYFLLLFLLFITECVAIRRSVLHTSENIFRRESQNKNFYTEKDVLSDFTRYTSTLFTNISLDYQKEELDILNNKQSRKLTSSNSHSFGQFITVIDHSTDIANLYDAIRKHETLFKMHFIGKSDRIAIIEGYTDDIESYLLNNHYIQKYIEIPPLSKISNTFSSDSFNGNITLISYFSSLLNIKDTIKTSVDTIQSFINSLSSLYFPSFSSLSNELHQYITLFSNNNRGNIVNLLKDIYIKKQSFSNSLHPYISMTYEGFHLKITTDSHGIVPILAYLSLQPYIMSISRYEPITFVDEMKELNNNEIDIDKRRRLNDRVKYIITAGQTIKSEIYERGLNGTGQVICVADTGVDTNHCLFFDPLNDVIYGNTNPNTKHRKVILYTGYADTTERMYNNHGTHVSGTAVGYTDGDQFKYNGVAYGAKLSMFDIEDSHGNLLIPNNLQEYYQLEYTLGVRILSNSWGKKESNIYTEDTASTDEYIYNHPDMVIIFAAANSGASGPGHISTLAIGKNTISVGSTYNSGEVITEANAFNYVLPSSSYGNTLDNRIKPDIYTVGSLRSAVSNSECEISNKQGTSMATPAIAGAIAIIRQYLMEGYYPEGIPSSSSSLSPSASLLKAMIIHSAVPLKGKATTYTVSPAVISFNKTPNSMGGWGRAQLDRVLFLANYTPFNLFLEDQIVGRENGTILYTLDIDPSYDLRVTLTWTDPPASSLSTNNLINDLDLYIIIQNNTLYSNSLPYFDRNNNIETISIFANDLNKYINNNSNHVNITIYVKAFMLSTSSQSYSIVLTGRFENGFQHYTEQTEILDFSYSSTLFSSILLILLSFAFILFSF